MSLVISFSSESPVQETRLVQNTAADTSGAPRHRRYCQRVPHIWHSQINRGQTSIERFLNLNETEKLNQ